MKKITAILLCLVMAWNLGLICASAADNQEFIVNVYQETDGELNLLCAVPGEEIKQESFEVTLGEDSLPVLSVSEASKEQIPRTIYCLVDISGSMKGRMEQAKEILHEIGAGLNEKENLVIGKMGNQITDSGFLTTQDEINAEIDSLQYTGEDTDLYGGLVHGIKFLKQGSGVNPLRALVVISDGCDDQGDGSTWKEAYEAVGKADIPVYTAAIILSPADYELAKDLGSFARNSAGGVHFPKSDNESSRPVDMTGAEIGQEILESIDGTVHLRTDLSGVQKGQKDTFMLSVTFQGESGKAYEDSLELKAGELKLLTGETEVQTQEAEETEASGPTPVEDKGSGSMLPIVIIGALLTVAIVAALLYRKKKQEEKRLEDERLEKARQEQERQRKEQQEREKELARQKELQKAQEEKELALAREREEARRREEEEARKREQEEARRRELEEARKRELDAFNALPRLNVRLVAIGNKERRFTIQLVKGYEMTIGRNGKAKVILDPQDTKLSGLHFVMFWDGGSVYVWDGQSKNGTFINGVVANHLGRVAVRPGDCIRAGSYEYRLYWEE